VQVLNDFDGSSMSALLSQRQTLFGQALCENQDLCNLNCGPAIPTGLPERKLGANCSASRFLAQPGRGQRRQVLGEDQSRQPMIGAAVHDP